MVTHFNDSDLLVSGGVGGGSDKDSLTHSPQRKLNHTDRDRPASKTASPWIGAVVAMSLDPEFLAV